LSANSLITHKGVIGIVVVMVDISEHKKMDVALQQARTTGEKSKTSQHSGEEKKNGIGHWGFGCDSFSVCGYLFNSANIRIL